jgi:hypothetical protein
MVIYNPIHQKLERNTWKHQHATWPANLEVNSPITAIMVIKAKRLENEVCIAIRIPFKLD